MAYVIKVQDGNILFTSSDSTSTDVNMSVNGNVSITKTAEIGNDPLASGTISTATGSPADLIIQTQSDGINSGNIRLEPAANGNILLNNVSWPDGTVSPIPGMFVGVSSANNLQFYPFILPGLVPSNMYDENQLNTLFPSATIGQFALGPDVIYIYTGTGSWRVISASVPGGV